MGTQCVRDPKKKGGLKRVTCPNGRIRSGNRCINPNKRNKHIKGGKKKKKS